MTKTLKQFDAEFSKLIASREYSDEDVFNIGVQIGKLMQATGTTDFRPSVFIEQEEQIRQDEAEKLHRIPYTDYVDKISIFLDSLVHKAATEQLKIKSVWQPNLVAINNGKFDESIAEKFCLQFVGSNYNSFNDYYTLQFEFVGKLCDFLKSKSLPINFTVHYSNYHTDRKDDKIKYESSIEDLSVDHIDFVDSLYDLELAEVEKFWVDLHKPFLFMMIKNT